MAILLENARVVTLERRRPVLEKQQLVVDQGKIAAMGPRIRPGRFAVGERIDCSGRIVMPGLVNAHSHLTEILQKSFRDNVRMEIWRGYRALTEDMAHLTSKEIGAAAQLACGEMLKNGVTAVVDHFSTRPGLTVEKMEAILAAFKKTGIRGVLAPSLRDQDFLRLIGPRASRGGPSRTRAEEPWREEVLAVLQGIRKSPGTADLVLGPSSPLNCSDALLRDVVEMAERHGLGLHTHLLETRLQRSAADRLYRGGVVRRLSRLGFLSRRLSAAHGVWLDDRDMGLLASSGTSVVHNPASNLKLGSGVAPVVKLKSHGVNVAVGTDGGDTCDSYSIFEQMRLAAFLSRLTDDNPDHWVTALDALRMGTVNGARAIPGWRGKIGKIATGYRADILILKPHLRLYPLSDVIHQLIFCEGGQSVDTVLVDGEIVVRNGNLTRVREKTLVEKVEPISHKLQRLYGRIKKQPRRVESRVRRLYREMQR